MSWWSRLTGGKSPGETRPQRINYLNEALALERQGDYAAALTSYRLALRDKPDDYRVLQNMAIAYSRTGQLDEAVRCYRRALQLEPSLSGAHYGLAFLLLKRGEAAEAREHLLAFLDKPPKGPESDRWIRHARATLESMDGGDTGGPLEVEGGDMAAFEDGGERLPGTGAEDSEGRRPDSPGGGI
jgi:tetratricopeptide (TPR) repeat protein